jgi:hypothetical protein
VIKDRAFEGCLQLTTVNGGEGLEEIGEAAFSCTTLKQILIPRAVKAIKEKVFWYCAQLSSVILGDGLEEIGEDAFYGCTSIREIKIPHTVRVIRDTAFGGCTSLTRVVFCDEIEEFVTAESMRDWWSQGVHEKSLRTYCFLVKCDIPKRLGSLRFKECQTKIHGMLRRIPFTPPEDMDAYFDTIDFNLTDYEKYSKDTPTLSGLAI